MGDVIDFGPGGKKDLSDSDGKPLISREIEDSLAKEVRQNPTQSRSALAMRIAGASFDEIARVLDYRSPSSARIAVEKQLADSIPPDQDYRGLRALANARLDALLKAVFPRAIDRTDADQLAYSRMALAVVDRQAKLNGLDAPQVHLINPTGDELTTYVEQLALAMGQEQVEEGDIFALEADDDGVWGPADEPEA
jgi:hypothetical protein